MAVDEALDVVSPYAAKLTRPVRLVADDLQRYVALLNKWQAVQNLVSRETLPMIWHRHIADSLQLLKYLRPEDEKLLDLGSGGGLPSIPLVIARKGAPGATFRLTESNARKASFLRTAARELDLPVTVMVGRIEELDPRETSLPDLITSRALARLEVLCRLSAPFFGPKTHAIFHKGREYGEELAETRAHWDFDMLVFPSGTSSDGILLEISNLRTISKS